ncbi:hypothetical protein [Flexivirga caeni]|uniref:Uncharacterized protein n=1 Tax=Flexivirga caeni TaxID=2294115 RepID=A0A3M9MFE4_9MICO|nr:hypothetical protein [Flexivirga caeni]RNI23867.1 hypothetical protein EFY87_06245 [Flexivirga caeni]
MPTSGDDESRSANDEFMDRWSADAGDGNDPEPERGVPGLLPGALLGAGVAVLCGICIYLLAGGGTSGSSQVTVTYTGDGQTTTVTQQADDTGGDAVPSTVTVTAPPNTVTIEVTRTGRATTLTSTRTHTVTSTAKPQTKTVTETTTVTQPPVIGPTSPLG